VVLPRSNSFVSRMIEKINVTLASSMVRPRVFNEDFRNIVFYIDDLATDRRSWSKVFMADTSDPGVPRVIMANSGTWIGDSTGGKIQLHLD